MRPARRASPPRHPDPPVNPRSTLPYPTCGRLQKPPTGYQSLTRPATGISRPPIASYLPPHLGSKMTKARTAGRMARRIAADWQALYEHPVYLLETFIDPERFAGTGY